MSLIPHTLRAALLANGVHAENGRDDPFPVIKLFTPDANGTWLLARLDPHRPDLAFGLCDPGLGSPELGDVLISELEDLRGPLGLPVEMDILFEADRPLSVYAAEARRRGRIVA